MNHSKLLSNSLCALLLTFLLVACKQQPSPVSQALPTLIPTASVLTESNEGGDASPASSATSASTGSATDIVTSDSVSVESSPSSEAIPPTPIPAVQGTPSPISTVSPSTALADDGSWVLFLERNDEYAPVTLYAVKPDGSNLVVLAEAFDNGARLLDSTADGQWVLMASQVKGTYLLKLDGSQEQISLDSRPANNGAWSPDEQRLLLVFEDGVVVADATTGQGTALPLPLTFGAPDPNTTPQPGYVEGASWSPDGSWVVAQQVGRAAEGQLVRSLYRYTLASATLTTLFQNNASGMFSPPLVAPDGQTILTGSLTTNSGLVRWPVAGGEPTPLANRRSGRPMVPGWP